MASDTSHALVQGMCNLLLVEAELLASEAGDLLLGLGHLRKLLSAVEVGKGNDSGGLNERHFELILAREDCSQVDLLFSC